MGVVDKSANWSRLFPQVIRSSDHQVITPRPSVCERRIGVRILVNPSPLPPMDLQPVEFVERKGVGHPDTLCDKAAEELSIALMRYYQREFGAMQHYNVDKALLVGGVAEAEFGRGRVTRPIELFLCGRACARQEADIEQLVHDTTRAWLAQDLPHLNLATDIVISSKIRPGSRDLQGVFDANRSPLANDTSFGVGYAPLSEVERIVLGAEQTLNAPETKQKLPALGQDIKVMGVRYDDEIRITIAAAFVAGQTPDRETYLETKRGAEQLVQEVAGKITRRSVRVEINTADRPEDNLFYLTATGTSAEQGDDGQVGRGNRPNGLITPHRAMTLEAAAGKNPRNHVGKIYSIAAQQIAQRLATTVPGVKNAQVYIVSQIGKPIDTDANVNIQVVAEDLDTAQTEGTCIAREVLAGLPNVWRGVMEREFSLY
jgi:S-adenosylmethionine synthetase